ncbi:flagellar biosynthetic protein FliR [Roseibium aestuarii]|uniref:Flagellar biosynthetic protein FliR n=1 Tax=Roseibium aestuarii TaxID=2600299 RepID=A0ABW4JWZ9_9HYPH|nr:flagellar biosynthetic protein FliR [Roseibium aestuarii]
MTVDLSFLPQIAVVYMLMFARLGSMLMLLPALGETSIPMRMRLSVALMLTLVLYPVGAGAYPEAILSNPLRLFMLLGGEFVIGFSIGLIAKMITSVLQTGGIVMANMSGLSFALGSDLTTGQQGALLSNYLSILGVTLIFLTDSHYLVIAALHDSFDLFPPGQWVPVGDFAELATTTAGEVLSIATRLSAPFIVVGLVFYFGLGLLNKLMPQMQIFFIAMPVNIGIGLVLFLVLLSAMMTFYLDHFQQALGVFTNG